jgi:opacity protein-like surface antigen
MENDMKLAIKIAAALGLATATLAAAAPADAAQRYGYDRHDRGYHGRDWDHGRRWDRGPRRGWDGPRRGYGYGYRDRHHPRCWNEWRGRHRARICR